MDKTSKYGLKMYQGDTANIQVNGIPIDDIYTVYFQLNNGSIKLLEKSVESVLPIDESETTSVVFSFASSDTETITPGTYSYGIKLTKANGTEITAVPPLSSMQVKNCVCSKSVAEFILLPKQVDGNNA